MVKSRMGFAWLIFSENIGCQNTHGVFFLKKKETLKKQIPVAHPYGEQLCVGSGQTGFYGLRGG